MSYFFVILAPTHSLSFQLLLLILPYFLGSSSKKKMPPKPAHNGGAKFAKHHSHNTKNYAPIEHQTTQKNPHSPAPNAPKPFKTNNR